MAEGRIGSEAKISQGLGQRGSDIDTSFETKPLAPPKLPGPDKEVPGVKKKWSAVKWLNTPRSGGRPAFRAPAAAGGLSDPALRDIVDEYDATYTDTHEPGLIPESGTSLNVIREEIKTAGQIGALTPPAGPKEALELNRAALKLMTDPAEQIRLKKAEGAGIPEILTMGPAIMNAGSWERATAAAGENPEIVETMGGVIKMDVHVGGGLIQAPVAQALRKLEHYSHTPDGGLEPNYIRTPFAQRPEILRRIGWEILGIPYAGAVVGQESPIHYFVVAADNLFQMTWRAAELGDRRVDYAWKTQNLADSLANDAGLHEIFRSGRGKAVLEDTLHSTSFWEALADGIGEAQAQAVGLKVWVGGRLVMADSYEHVLLENIDYTKPKKPILVTTASDGRKADAIREHTTGISFLAVPRLDSFLIAVMQQKVFTHLVGVKRAEDICALFNLMADFGIQQEKKHTRGWPELSKGLAGHVINLRDKCGLDLSDAEVVRLFESVREKYKNNFGDPVIRVHNARYQKNAAGL